MLHDELTNEVERLEGSVRDARNKELLAVKNAEKAVGIKENAELQLKKLQQKTQVEKLALSKIKNEKGSLEKDINDKRDILVKEQRKAEKVALLAVQEMKKLGIETLQVASDRRVLVEKEEALDRKDKRLHANTESCIATEKKYRKAITETDTLKLQLQDTIDKYKKKSELADVRNEELLKAKHDINQDKKVSAFEIGNRERDVKYREDAVVTREKQNEIEDSKLAEDRSLFELEREELVRQKAAFKIASKRAQTELELRKKENAIKEMRMDKIVRDNKIEKEYKQLKKELKEASA